MNPVRKNKRWLSAAEFSDITGVGQDALCYWDAIGVFRPLRNKETGCPYYALEQRLAARFIAKVIGVHAPSNTKPITE